MGGVPSKTKQQIKIEDLPRVEPEPDYDIKTRSPMPDSWSLNIMRGKREDELRLESYRMARRKCLDYVRSFEKCTKEKGTFWAVFDCQEENHLMQTCFEHEVKVEMDKRRRDLSRHSEWWWRDLYDENGEVGDQAEWDGSWFLTLKIKDFLGISWKKKPEAQAH